MLTGTAVANAANIAPKNPVPAGSCLKSQYQPGLGCPDWADEFDGTEVNKDFWSVYNGYSEVNQDPYGKYTKDAVTVKDGKLHLTTKVGANGQKGESAEMSTNNKAAFEDGYWEFKVSSYSGYGHVGGYLYGNGNVAGPQLGEVDGYEAFGSTVKETRNESGKKEKFDQSNKNQTIIHYSQDAINAQTGKKVTHGKPSWFQNKPVGEPVVVGILKTADGIKVFRDGELVQEMKSSDPNYAKSFPAGQPLNTTLTARVSNVYWGLQSNPTGGISFDYVRHYPLVTAETPKPAESTPSAKPTPAPPTATPTPVEVKPTVDAPQPTETPKVEPTVTPAPAEPTASVEPTAEPTKPAVTNEPTEAPAPVESSATSIASPSPSPTSTASLAPVAPTAEPTKPVESPTEPSPSVAPTANASSAPVVTAEPSSVPVVSGSGSPTASPPPVEQPASEASTPTGEDASANKSGDRVVDSSNPSSTKAPSDSSNSSESSKPEKPIVAATGHDSGTNWFAVGISAIIAGVVAVIGWLWWAGRSSGDKS
jgi:plus agglutinin